LLGGQGMAGVVMVLTSVERRFASCRVTMASKDRKTWGIGASECLHCFPARWNCFLPEFLCSIAVAISY
jgi:hypothetical protein